MIISMNGYALKCEGCGKRRTEIGFELGMTYLWSNQYGCEIRLFCHRCGAVHNVKIMPDKQPEIERQNWQCSVPAKSYEV